MLYFAYGSNMSQSRLSNRIPGADRVGTFTLYNHDLRFHKIGQDGSGKCDAYHTDNPNDFVLGVLFEVRSKEKFLLDKIEGLGSGYDEKTVTVYGNSNKELTATTYFATKINTLLKPFAWYKKHVLVGARESKLPESYIRSIRSVEAIRDPNAKRAARESAIHS